MSAEADEELEADGAIIIVTGARAERRLADAPVATEVITREEIEASGAERLSDVLEEQGHVEIVRTFAGAGVRLQGLDPKYVQVLVDGQRLTGRTNGTIDLSRISVEDIEQVEILRGASSSLYGADALGGVVNIITRKRRAPVEASISARTLRMESADTAPGDGDARARVAGVEGPWSGHLTGAWGQLPAFDRDPTNAATTGSAQQQWSVAGEGARELGEGDRLALQAEYVRRRSDAVDVSGGGAVFDRSNLTENVTASLQPQLSQPGGLRLRGLLGFALFRDQFFRNQRGSDALDVYEETYEQSSEARIAVETPLSDTHLLTAGVEGLVASLNSPRLDAGAGQRQRGAAFVQDEWFIGERWVVMPGVRVDVDSQFGVYPTANLSARWDVSEAWTTRASVGRGYRAPSFRELVLRFDNSGAGYQVEGNPDLEPETSLSAQLNVTWTPAHIWELDVGVYRNAIDGLITSAPIGEPVPGSPLLFSYINLGQAVTQGVEASSRLRPFRGATWDLAYTLLDSEDVDTGRPLDGRAMHRVTGSLRQRYAPWGVEGTVRGAWSSARPFFIADSVGGEPRRAEADPNFVLDVRAAKAFGPHAEVFVGGDNLLDEGDATLLLLQPRRFYAGISGRY